MKTIWCNDRELTVKAAASLYDVTVEALYYRMRVATQAKEVSFTMKGRVFYLRKQEGKRHSALIASSPSPFHREIEEMKAKYDDMIERLHCAEAEINDARKALDSMLRKVS